MEEKGVVFGNFQVFHFREMEYILAAKMRCKILYIGIVCSDFAADEQKEEEQWRKKKESPLTYKERLEIIRDALLDFGIQRQEFEIVPFPLIHPELIFEYTPADAVYYMNIQTDTEEKIMQILVDKGAKAEVLWKGSSKEKRMTGNDVCRLIAEGDEWKQYVPKSAVEYMISSGIDERIRRIFNNSVQNMAFAEKTMRMCESKN